MSETTPSSFTHVTGLAKGGMGTVTVAIKEGEGFQRLYAIKRLHPHLSEDRDLRRMFLDEARIAGFIQHPNVVGVHDTGDDDHGPFLVMEYVEGVPLSQLISATKGAIPLTLGLQVIEEAALGLHAAHQLSDMEGTPLKVVHRDVSPANILVGFNGTVKVTDFGIAKALGRQTKTNTGVIKGKFGYMCPEQLRYDKVDHRGDLFSLGVVLFELLSGRRLYPNDEDNSGLKAILQDPPPDLGAIREDAPPELVDLLIRMLAKSPDHRPPTAEAVATQLHAVRQTAFEEALEDEELTLKDFMREVFPDLQEQWRESVRVAVASAALAPAPVRPKTDRWKWAVGIGAASLLVAAGVFMGRTVGAPSATDAQAVTAASLTPEVGTQEPLVEDDNPSTGPTAVNRAPADEERGEQIEEGAEEEGAAEEAAEAQATSDDESSDSVAASSDERRSARTPRTRPDRPIDIPSPWEELDRMRPRSSPRPTAMTESNTNIEVVEWGMR